MNFLKYILWLIIPLIYSSDIIAQNRNSVWCFGDSALVDFSDTSNIVTGHSSVKSRGSCTSISDSSGNLLFYVAYDPTTIIGGTDPVKVYGQNNLVISNGDSIKGGGLYHELTIVPYPGSDSLFYVFNIGVTLDLGFYYSIVDMSANSGFGAVIQKNVQLENFQAVDCLSAVKHGNGRDWWVIVRRFDGLTSPNNDFYFYLVTPSGVISQPIQSLGSQNNTNIGQISFNTDGTKMSFINYKGLIELYDFHRCTGLVGNPVTISSESLMFPWPENWSAEFSPSGNLLYLSQFAAFPPDSCYLIQFNLNASNIAQSADTIWKTPYIENMGQLKLAVDGKIYLSSNFGGGYPYSDSLYNYRNMNLSVINSPDSLGTLCDYQPFSFYLGGKRTYFGLPNNPDYDLEPLAGSPCDTLVSISEQQLLLTPHLNIFYNSQWQTAFINSSNLSGTKGTMEFFDVQGKIVHREDIQIVNGYYTRNFNMSVMADGMYFVNLISEGQRLSGKLVKY